MLKKAPNNKIQFHILFENKATYIPVTYDSLFTRHDDYSLTLEYAIPLNIIKGFGKTIYWAASADSTGIFFSDKWRVKNQLGTQGDAQYGVFMSVDPISSDRCDKRLSDNKRYSLIFLNAHFKPIDLQYGKAKYSGDGRACKKANAPFKNIQQGRCAFTYKDASL